MTKHNLGPRAASLAYSIAPALVGDGIATNRVIWSGASELLATDLLADNGGERAGSALEDAVVFLREELQGEAQPARDIEREAKAIGISSATLRRARDEIGVVAEKHGFGREGHWRWRLPTSPKGAKALTPNDERLSGELDGEVPAFPHTQAKALIDAKALIANKEDSMNALVNSALSIEINYGSVRSCEVCKRHDYWRHVGDDWAAARCLACAPPPADAVIVKRWGAAA